MPHRERMSSVDTAWLRMDRPNNLMMIVGVLALDGTVDSQRLRDTLEARFSGAFARFRTRPVQDATGWWWEEDARFELDHHLLRAKLPGRGTAADLKRLVGRLAAKPLDHRRPRWQFHLIENYQGGNAVIVRIHHCYADGIALIGVMLSLTDKTADAPPARPAPLHRGKRAGSGSAFSAVREPFGDLVAGALNIVKQLSAVRDPGEIVRYVGVAAGLAAEIAQLVTMPDDSRTRFKGPPTVGKRVAWADPVDLDEVKAVGRVLGCSVNDVLLACVAGALREYLQEKGDPVAGVEIRAMVPVNLRPIDQFHALGNKFGLVTLLLPVATVNPLERLRTVHARMEALKTSYQPVVAFGLLALAGVCPQSLQTQGLDLLANKASAVMTNVPGPPERLYLAGHRIENMMFWVPQSGDIGMGVSILSYGGGVQFGLVTDAGRVPDPERIAARFGPEFERLVVTVLMEPWDGAREPALVEKEIARAGARLRRRA